MIKFTPYFETCRGDSGNAEKENCSVCGLYFWDFLGILEIKQNFSK